MWSGLDYGQHSALIAEVIKEAEMERIALVHLSGSKANQEDRFPLDRFKEITLGRDPASSVRFSEETEVMVGRQHARITRNPALPSLFFITDLGSRNGTFVNQQRIFGATILKPGDVVQCGVGGPEFRFDVEPETDHLNADPPPRPTASLLEQPRAQSAAPDLPPAASSDMTVAPADAPRSAPAEGRTRKLAAVGSGVLIGLIALVAGYVGYRSLRSNNLNEAEKPGATPQQSASPDASAEKYGHVHSFGGSSGAAAEAEKDAQRAAWRIEVAPYLSLGSGRPGNAASDFNKPAGVAFSPTGLLFATDDGNRRVQIWDVKTGSRLAEFGHDAFGGEIADIAFAPDSQALITDQARGLAYVFTPPQPGALAGAGKPLGPYDYQFKDVRFGDQGFVKIGGVAVDSKGRVYVVDAPRNDVLRFNPDGAPDKTWNFEKTRAGGDTHPHGCEGIAIDEVGGDLFVASERDAVVEVFDWETGAYKNRLVGAAKDASGKPAGKRVFFGPVRGMTVARRRLLAVDESAGHIQIFDLARTDAFDTDLAGYAAPQRVRGGGYQGFFGRAPLFDFEDRTNTELQRQVESGAIIPGQANPPGHFCSPSSIANHTDQASGETYIAIADQCNYRIVVYRWSDIAKALGAAETPAGATLATSKAANKTAGAVPGKPAAAPKRNLAPRHSAVVSRPAAKVTGKDAVKGHARASSGKNKQTANTYNGPVIDSKEAKKAAKKAKKEKKVKY